MGYYISSVASPGGAAVVSPVSVGLPRGLEVNLFGGRSCTALMSSSTRVELALVEPLGYR